MTTEPEPALSAILRERRHLINLGYRLLGSLAEAEDVVQETYARWYALPPSDRDAIASPGAWLTKVAGRICLDLLGSARARRERYVGDWIPEPLPGRTDGAPADPADRVTLDESVGMAFLVVLDSMTPAERVAFILHDVFRYPYADIAEIVGRSPAACRQLATSARRRIGAARASAAAPPADRAGLVRDFRRAWQARDIAALVALLDPDATVTADGGGLVPASLEPIRGGNAVAHFAVDLATRVPDLTLVERTVNGEPGLVVQHDGVTVTVMAFEIKNGHIKHIWAVRNPDKLRPWR